MQLPQLAQQLRLRLIDGKLLPLDVYRSARIPLSRQQHSRLVLIEAEKHGSRLESFSRRRVGVVRHVPEKVSVGATAPRALFSDCFTPEMKKIKLFSYSLPDQRAALRMFCYLGKKKTSHVVGAEV